MRWFGDDGWGAPICREAERCATPTAPCYRCGVAFGPADRGVVMPFCGEPGDPPELAAHLACFLRALGLGGATPPPTQGAVPTGGT